MLEIEKQKLTLSNDIAIPFTNVSYDLGNSISSFFMALRLLNDLNMSSQNDYQKEILDSITQDLLK